MKQDEALYPHQREAINKLKSGSILCGDTGTGKSRTALAYYFISSGGNIGEHFGDKDFIFPKVRRDLYIITTAQKRDKKEWELEMVPFLLTAKAVDSWNNIKKYKDVCGAFFIFDEQHVTGTGAWVKAFYEIAKKNKWILLSATPGDTWSDYIPVFVANGYFRNKYQFEQEHVIFNPYITKYRQVMKYVNTGRLLKIKNEIVVKMPYMKDTNKLYYNIKTNYNKEKYNLILKKRWNPYLNEPIAETGNLCYLLRRVCNEDISKLEAIDDILMEHPKAIIFYSFDYELEDLRMYCNSVGILYSEWNGHKHEPVPEGDSWVYLVNYYSGGEGWNCITTDTMILYSQSYSYKSTIQAEGRIDRMNTPYKTLYYYKLASHSPIDWAIKEAFIKKKEFNEKEYTEKFLNKYFGKENL